MGSADSARVERTILRPKGQLTIPAAMREALHLSEGDPVDLELHDDAIVLRPRKAVPAEQAWFWTESWQGGEREAEADLAAWRLETFDSGEDFIAALRTRAKASRSRRAP